jgi:hypothetical protein
MRTTNRSRRVLKLLAGSLALLPFAGCDENHRHRDDGYGYERRSSPPPVIVEERRVEPPPPPVVVEEHRWYEDQRYSQPHPVYEQDRRSRDLRAGANVPRSAREVAVDRGHVEWRADRPGRVFVTESEFDRVIWNGRVWPGEVVEVIPRHNRIFVNHAEVIRTEMKDKIRYRIWYERE